MPTHRTRRAFLQDSARLVAGAAAAALPLAAAADPSGQTIRVACVDGILRHTEAPDCWSALRSVGAEGIEATIADDLSLPRLFHPERKYSLATPADVDALRADVQAAGSWVTALCMHNRFDERPVLEREWAVKTAHAAQALGVKAVRIDVVARKKSKEELLPFAVELLKKLMAATESTGTVFGVENHGATTNDPEFLRALFAGVGSPRLGLTLDAGNFYWFGHPLSKLYAIYEEFAPRVFHTHCKSIKYPPEEREKQRPMGWKYRDFSCPLDEGDVDYRRVVAILRKAGYANALCIEDESLGKLPAAERKAALARDVQYLKAALR